jgi:hypothetical protein
MPIQVGASTTNILTLFEYEWTDALSDREIRLLSKLSRTGGIEILKPFIRQEKTYFQARQYVGILRLGQRTIQILPKFHRSSDRQQSEQEATRNLLLMLDYARHLGIREVNLASLNSAQDWFEVLIYLFALNLKRQWLKGAARTYEPIDAVLPVLKGKWRLSAQMHRPEQKHLFAQNDPDHKYLLVIDEINRANIAKVFGELITLIEDDKRLAEEHEISVQLPYSKETFGVPENLLILGTMNTADRSIALLDIALRRRFTFVEQMPNPSLLEMVEGVDLGVLLDRLNRRITVLLGRDYQIGHSYLMDIDSLETLHFAWYRKIMPLLQEYFYNDWERLRAVVGNRFIKPAEVDEMTRQALGDFYEEEGQFEVRVYDTGSGFLEALQSV